MKNIARFFAWTILVLAILVLAKNAIAKAAIEKGVRLVTGLPLSIAQFDFSLTKGYVSIQGLELRNPAGFTEKVMVSIPKVYVDIEPAALFKGKAHVEDLQVHLKEFNVVKNQQGQLNLDSLKTVADSKKSQGAPQSGDSAQKAKAPEIKIDHVVLKIEKVSYKDYSGAKPSEQNFNINLNEEYKDVANLNALVSLIVVKAMMSTTIASLTQIDLGGLQDSVSGVMSSSAKLATDAAAKAEGLVQDTAAQVMEKVDAKEAAEALEGAAKSVTGGLTSAAGSLKDKLPSFGLGSKEQSK